MYKHGPHPSKKGLGSTARFCMTVFIPDWESNCIQRPLGLSNQTPNLLRMWAYLPSLCCVFCNCHPRQLLLVLWYLVWFDFRLWAVLFITPFKFAAKTCLHLNAWIELYNLTGDRTQVLAPAARLLRAQLCPFSQDYCWCEVVNMF